MFEEKYRSKQLSTVELPFHCPTISQAVSLSDRDSSTAQRALPPWLPPDKELLPGRCPRSRRGGRFIVYIFVYIYIHTYIYTALAGDRGGLVANQSQDPLGAGLVELSRLPGRDYEYSKQIAKL